jgi:DNA-binding IclR family transcriptional regulator
MVPVPKSASQPEHHTDMVGKALTLLTGLGEHPKGASASELARGVGYPLSTAHRLLAALVRDGYAKFDQSTKRYSLGLRVFQLAQNVSRSQGFSGLATPILDQISVTTREATMLAVLDGERQLYVYCNAGPQQVSVVGEPGKHGPLYCTSQGKVLIAFSAPDIREYLLRRLTLEPMGPNTITDRNELRHEIERVRARGYAIADEEHEAGIRAIGVPVLNHEHLVAAIATAAPAYRISLDQLREHLPTLTAAAAELAVVMPRS